IFDLRGQRFAVVSFWVQLVVCFVCKNSSRFAEQKLRDRRHAPSDHYWSHLRGEGFCDERFHIVASGVHPFTMIFTFDDGRLARHRVEDRKIWWTMEGRRVVVRRWFYFAEPAKRVSSAEIKRAKKHEARLVTSYLLQNFEN